MEKIRINEIVKRGVVCIVKYDSLHPTGAIKPNLEATLNTNFNAQEISYLENDVGIGGTVDVLIVEKLKNPGNPADGHWVNITNVDMTSAVKGEKGPSMQMQKEALVKPSQEKFRTPSEMVATELTCAMIRQDSNIVICGVAVEMYNEVLRLLDE